MKPFAFSKPPYYQTIQSKGFSPYGKIKPLQPEKLKWPTRLSYIGLLCWIPVMLFQNGGLPLIFSLGLLGFFIFSAPSFYILLRRTAIDPK